MFGAFETDRPEGGTHFLDGQHYKLVDKTKTYFRYCTFKQNWVNTCLKTLPEGNTYQERLDKRNLLTQSKSESDKKSKEKKRAKKVSKTRAAL